MSERRAFAVSIFARHAGRVLLIEHKRLGTWLPVGGEIEAGETPLHAAVRELREETGLVGRFAPMSDIEGAPLGLLGYEEHAAGTKGLHMCFAFVADVENDRVIPNDEFAAFEWVTSPTHLQMPENVHQLVRLALRPTSTALVGLAERWLAAFNARDLDGLIALYELDAMHVSPRLRDREPATKGEIHGTVALRAWWHDSLQRLPQLHYAPLHITAMGDRVFMEYLRTNPGEADLHVAEVLVVSARSKIASSRVYHS